MTDTPPTSDKNPRRRGAPRKRATKTEAVAMPELVAKPTQVESATATTTRGSSRRNGRGGRGTRGADAVAGDASSGDAQPIVSTENAAVDVSLENDASATGDIAMSGDTTPESVLDIEASTTPTPHADESSIAPAPTAASSSAIEPTTFAKAAHEADAPTAPAPAQAPASPPARAIQRQAMLRPGELIRVPLSVRWRDLDAFNHVNNSKYLSYLEEARLRWMLSVPGMGMDENVAPVVAASNLNYRRPIGWPADVVIELFVERVGGSSLTIGHRIVDTSDDGVVYCDGHVVMVWIDRRSGRSASLPDGVRAACR